MSALAAWIREARKAAQERGQEDDILRLLPLALRIAQERRGHGGVDYEDQIGAACVALVEAVRSYPGSEAERRGITLEAYVAQAVKWALGRAALDAPLARVPWHDWKRLKALQTRQAAMIEQTGNARVPDADLAAELGLTPEQVRYLRRLQEFLRNDAVRLDAKIDAENEKDRTFGEWLAADESFEDAVDRKVLLEQERPWLVQAVEALRPVLRAAVSLRFGLPVPSLRTIPFGTVVDAALHIGPYTHQGLKALRGRRRDEQGDVPAMVPRMRRSDLGIVKARTAAKGSSDDDRLQESWRLLTSDEGPPLLARLDQHSGTVRAGE